MEQCLLRMATDISAAYGCTCNKTYGDEPGNGAPAVVNDAELSSLAQHSVEKVAPEALQGAQPAWLASEAFGEYCLKFPCVFAFVGIADRDRGYGAAHHNRHFDFDEGVLPLGVKATVQFAADFLQST